MNRISCCIMNCLFRIPRHSSMGIHRWVIATKMYLSCTIEETRRTGILSRAKTCWKSLRKPGEVDETHPSCLLSENNGLHLYFRSWTFRNQNHPRYIFTYAMLEMIKNHNININGSDNTSRVATGEYMPTVVQTHANTRNIIRSSTIYPK